MPASAEKELRPNLRAQLTTAIDRLDAALVRLTLADFLKSSPNPGDFAFAAMRLRSIGSDKALQAGFKVLRTYIARSVTVEPFLPQLAVHSAAKGLWLEFTVGGYGSFIDDLTNPGGELARAKPDLVLFLADIEDLAGSLTDVCARAAESEIRKEVERVKNGLKQMLSSFRRYTNASVVVQGLTVPAHPILGDVADSNLSFGEQRAVREINAFLVEICRELTDCVFFDQDQVAARIGRMRWRDNRMFYSSRVPIATGAFDEYCRALAQAVSVLYSSPKKVLCTDLDDTLWGGIVGEDGPEGILTGATFPGSPYFSYQKFLKQISARGILLTIVSKNNLADVEEAFRLRGLDLAVTLDDFVGKKISWHDKGRALKELSKELSLGLDSFVFIDDSPFECDSVRRQLPEVTVIEASREEPWGLVPRIMSAGLFETLAITEEDRIRSNEYRIQVKRADLENSSSSREEFLKSLDIRCKIVSALDGSLDRTVQLIAKTNQFNLTTRRYSPGEVQQFAQRPKTQLLALRAQDRFGDSGVVGLALCETQEDTCRIDTLLLSCRVIGRGLESVLLHHIARTAREHGAIRLLGEYRPTKKNQACADFYPSHGFQPLQSPTAEGTSMFYELNISSSLPQAPDWITIDE